MRERRRADTEHGGPPEWLTNFVLDDWIDRTEPIPETWRGETGYHYFKARRAWSAARREWCTERGMGVLEFLRMTRPPRPYDRQPPPAGP